MQTRELHFLLRPQDHVCMWVVCVHSCARWGVSTGFPVPVPNVGSPKCAAFHPPVT